jgi:hypothetical protein
MVEGEGMEDGMSTRGAILIDSATRPDLDYDLRFLEALGHEVVVCPGPAWNELCPILAGDVCLRLEAADGVIFALDLERPQHRAILRQYRERLGSVPLQVVVRPDQCERYAADIGATPTWTRSPSTLDLDEFSAEVEGRIWAAT